MIKTLVKKFGGYLFGQGSLPKGVDVFHDISRYGYGVHVQNVMDVGANVGDFAAAVLHLPALQKVICVEPSKANFEALALRFASEARVRCIRKALGSNSGTCRLHLSESSMFHSVRPLHGNEAGIEDVLMATVDELSAEFGWAHVDLLKTDTEGFDLEVLTGADTLMSGNGVFLVLCEVGFHEDDDRHTSFTGVWNLLSGRGFDLVGFYEQSAFWHWHSLDFANALFINRVLAAERLGTAFQR